MKRKELEARITLLYDLMHKTQGSGIDAVWHFTAKNNQLLSVSYDYLAHMNCSLQYCLDTVPLTRSKVLTINNSFHCMDEHGFYSGWADFSVIFPNNKPLDEYRIVFHGVTSQRLQKKYDIKEHLDQVIIGAIHDLQETQTNDNSRPDTGTGETREAQA